MKLQTSALAGIRTLVVEDEILIAEELRERLARMGMVTVDIVDTAEAAERAADQHRPELILMDIRLKGSRDGIAAATAIRSRLHAPVVFLTAHSDHDTLLRAKEAGPYGYVLKPFNERELMVAIEMSLHRHELEGRLRESERRYAATLASIGDGVIATDTDGRVTFMNPVAASLTGMTSADAEGMPIDLVMPLQNEGSGDPVGNPLFLALASGGAVTLDSPVLLRRSDGEGVPIDDSAAPVVDDGGNQLGAVIAFRDIRQRRLAEEALRKAEERLREVQKLEAVGRLAGGVAHDFNNMLAVINGSAEFLLNEPVSEAETHKMLGDIHNTGVRAARLTQQLLAFSRTQHIEPVELDPGLLVADLVPLLENLAGPDVILEIITPSDLRQVMADPGQMEQLLMNLTVNARDAMPTGGRLTIEMSNTEVGEDRVAGVEEAVPGSYVRIRVQDTGAGMTPELRKRIFEPFFTTKDPGKGTGLGLATAYGIVTHWRGFIEVDSIPGAGTEFRVYLPALVPD
ncbi:MAG: response regulator [Candidatus Krumholzibacteriia bacterium]